MRFNEDTLAKETTANYLRDALGWEGAHAYNPETLGKGGTLSRKDESINMSIAEKTRKLRQEKRGIAFFVRAKTGAGSRDWSPAGVCIARKNGEGYTIKLNTLPIDKNWNGTLVLVPPLVGEVDEDAV